MARHRRLGALDRRLPHYSSCGPVLHAVEADGDTVRVACSSARAISVVGPPPIGAGLVAGTMGITTNAERVRRDDSWADGILDDDGLSGGVFHLPPYAAWFRVIVEDRAGRRAWSNPVWRTREGWQV